MIIYGNGPKHVLMTFTVLIFLAIGAAALMTSLVNAAGTTYYVDCSAATNGNGTQASPWNNLSTVNGTSFAAGDQILFKRGTTCVGQLWPKGSGVSGNPITVSAYGTGARPAINGNNAVAPVVTIKDQNYWTFDNLEIKNSTGLGLYVDGSNGADLYGFTLTNLYVHHGGMNDGQHLILVGLYQGHSVHDVLIDNVEASNGWRGIEIGGKCCNIPASRSTNITIRNANIHDVQSDGILMASSNNALAEHNLVSNTGLMTTLQNHTPNGLWTWDCDNCTVQFSEVYASHLPSWDGGAFDIDYFNHNNIVQYNYGHDNDAYCVAVFGGDGQDITTNNVVRYNICSNDARDGTYEEKRQGGIYMTVWSRGSIQDSYIYNNTIYWNPAGAYSAIKLFNIWHGQDILNTNIYNNIIYSASPNLVNVNNYTSQMHMNYNLYWYTGAGNPNFLWSGTNFTSFSSFKAGSGQEANGLYVNPLLNDPTYHSNGFPTTSFTLLSGSPAINAGANLVALGLQTSMGTRDFFGNTIPQGGAYDIGAHEFTGVIPPTATPGGPTPTPTNTPVIPTASATPAQTFTPNPGNNLALNKPVSVSSFQTGYPGSNAVDDNVATYWRTVKIKNNETRPPEWIYVDLGVNYSVQQVVLKWDPINRYATSYSIQTSTDGINWTTVYSTSSGNGGMDTISFASATARYVRLYTTAWNNQVEGNYLDEFEIYP
jgi:F5/8 type C domain-containing protein/parallel beta helix pectate lyase-like protein